MMTIKPICVLEELPFADLSLSQTYDLIRKRTRRRATSVLMADAALLMRCARERAVQTACLDADLILAEGEEVRVTAAKLGRPLEKEAFSACDLISLFVEKEEGRFFFLGGEKGMARRAAVAAASAVRRVPCPAVGGAPGNFCRKGRENTAVLTRIWECQPDVVVVLLEDGIMWFRENREKLPPALYICAPERTIRALVGEDAERMGERMPQQVWHACRRRLKLYFYVRSRMKKSV